MQQSGAGAPRLPEVPGGLDRASSKTCFRVGTMSFQPHAGLTRYCIRDEEQSMPSILHWPQDFSSRPYSAQSPVLARLRISFRGPGAALPTLFGVLRGKQANSFRKSEFTLESCGAERWYRVHSLKRRITDGVE